MKYSELEKRTLVSLAAECWYEWNDAIPPVPIMRLAAEKLGRSYNAVRVVFYAIAGNRSHKRSHREWHDAFIEEIGVI